MDYSKDGPFNDPVVRCDKCSRILQLAQIKKEGQCPHCGSKRIGSLQTFNDEELAQMKRWGVDEDFIALFHVKPEVPE